MASHKTPAVVVAIVLSSLALPACESSASKQTAADASTRHGIDRDAAIASARQDAWSTYRELAVSQVAAQRLGPFWIVELRSSTGPGVRYAISSHDGTIRQRSTIQ